MRRGGDEGERPRICGGQEVVRLRSAARWRRRSRPGGAPATATAPLTGSGGETVVLPLPSFSV
ncbi:exocyst protein [Sesbania bispinosa]|nr:exocyst protein [Sesbania bispinosa]